jgi:hypothetical protein
MNDKKERIKKILLEASEKIKAKNYSEALSDL